MVKKTQRRASFVDPVKAKKLTEFEALEGALRAKLGCDCGVSVHEPHEPDCAALKKRRTKQPKLKTFIVECVETEARSTTYRVTAASAGEAEELVKYGELRDADGGKNFTRIEDDYEDTLTCDVVGVREEK